MVITESLNGVTRLQCTGRHIQPSLAKENLKTKEVTLCVPLDLEQKLIIPKKQQKSIVMNRMVIRSETGSLTALTDLNRGAYGIELGAR
jgi:hypothetical protein